MMKEVNTIQDNLTKSNKSQGKATLEVTLETLTTNSQSQ